MNNSGGGHKATAQAFIEMARRQRRKWHIELFDLDVVLERADIFYQIFGVRSCTLYNLWVQSGWTIGTRYVLLIIHAALRLIAPFNVLLARRALRAMRPDLFFSLTPHYNQVLFKALQREAPGVRFVTMLTDFADLPPHFWFERQDQHVICGTARAAEQARAFVPCPDRISCVSGMMIHPGFFDAITDDRALQRAGIGLEPNRKTIVVCYGGQGAAQMFDIAQHIGVSGLPVQLIMLCGRNRRLAARLRGLPIAIPMHVQEYTQEMPRFLSMGDVFIGKPGPGLISEALVMGLPVLLQNDRFTMIHERYNVEWVEQNGVGLCFRNIRKIPALLRIVLEPDRHRTMCERVATVRPLAVFDVPDIIARLLDQRPLPGVSPAHHA